MLSPSHMSEASLPSDCEEDHEGSESGLDTTDPAPDMAQSGDSHDAEDIASRLAFTFDSSNLDKEGKPRTKLAKKLTRNESEKKRRDNLNAYIAELARLVPLILSSKRKLDKASVLRLTVSYLRIYHDLIKNGPSATMWKPEFPSCENLGNVMLESMGGFLLVVNKNGVLIFVTDEFSTVLGHCLVDVLGNSIYKIIHKDDKKKFAAQFKGFTPPSPRAGHEDSTDSDSDPESSPHRSFCVRMLVKTSKPAQQYKDVHIVAYLKSVPPLQNPQLAPGVSMRGEPDVCLVGVGRVVSFPPTTELCPAPDDTHNQWITRHELDGKITFSDQRGAWLTGFFPGESVGFSAYSLIHPDDIGAVATVHKKFLTLPELPKTVFRMYTKAKEVLYIQTDTHLIVDMWTSKPKFILSANEVLPRDEGERRLEEQRMRIAQWEAEDLADCAVEVEDSSADLVEDEVIPETTTDPDGKVTISVGQKKYKFKVKQESLGSGSPRQTIFDPNVHTDDTDDGIPTVKPKFLGLSDDSQDCSDVSQSQFDQVNARLGNDPFMVGRPTDYSQYRQVYGQYGDHSAGHLEGNGISALSSLGAMVSSNMGYPAQSCRDNTASSSNQMNQQRWNSDTAHGHVYPVTPQTLHQGHMTSEPPVQPGPSHTHDINSVDNLQSLPYMPSTGAKQNPLLVQLLNRKPVHNTRLRETVTSHLVPDILQGADVEDSTQELIGVDGWSNGSSDDDCEENNQIMSRAPPQYCSPKASGAVSSSSTSKDVVSSLGVDDLDLLLQTQSQSSNQQNPANVAQVPPDLTASQHQSQNLLPQSHPAQHSPKLFTQIPASESVHNHQVPTMPDVTAGLHSPRQVNCTATPSRSLSSDSYGSFENQTTPQQANQDYLQQLQALKKIQERGNTLNALQEALTRRYQQELRHVGSNSAPRASRSRRSQSARSIPRGLVTEQLLTPEQFVHNLYGQQALISQPVQNHGHLPGGEQLPMTHGSSVDSVTPGYHGYPVDEGSSVDPVAQRPPPYGGFPSPGEHFCQSFGSLGLGLDSCLVPGPSFQNNGDSAVPNVQRSPSLHAQVITGQSTHGNQNGIHQHGPSLQGHFPTQQKLFRQQIAQQYSPEAMLIQHDSSNGTPNSHSNHPVQHSPCSSLATQDSPHSHQVVSSTSADPPELSTSQPPSHHLAASLTDVLSNSSLQQFLIQLLQEDQQRDPASSPSEPANNTSRLMSDLAHNLLDKLSSRRPGPADCQSANNSP